MFELLGLLGGGVMRLLPMVVDFFKQGRDLKYELLRMEKEAELEKLRAQFRQDEIAAVSNAQVDASWAQGLVEATKAQAKVTGDKWLDRLNVSVRPVLTYFWCVAMYGSHKAVLIYVAIVEKTPLKDLAPVILTEFDRAVVGSIVGFWFMDRAIRAFGRK